MQETFPKLYLKEKLQLRNLKVVIISVQNRREESSSNLESHIVREKEDTLVAQEGMLFEFCL